MRLIALLLALAAGGAAQDDPGTAALRVLHLSPDAPLVDVLIDGRLAMRDVARRTRSGYVTVPAGRHEISVYPHRLPVAVEDAPLAPAPVPTPPASADGEPVDTADEPPSAPGGAPAATQEPPRPRTRPLEPVTALLDLANGSYTTVVLTGNFEPPSSEGGLGHISLAVEPADAQVTVSGPQGYLVQRRGEQLIRDLVPGTYQIEVRRQGFQTAEYEVEVQPRSTAVATLTLQAAEQGEPVDEPFVLQEETQGSWRRLELQPYSSDLPLPPAGEALVRFVQAAPGAPHLAIAMLPPIPASEAADGDEEAADDAAAPSLWLERLEYPNASDFQPILAGRYSIEFRIAGTDSVLRTLPELRLRPGVAYTLYLATAADGGGLEVVPVVDGMVPQRPADTEVP